MERVHASELIDLVELDELIAARYIAATVHPMLGYRILNYTDRTVIERRWTDTTERCRGLVLDADGYVVARPIRKFHNYTQVRPPRLVLTKQPRVFDKVDGSLGIVVPTPDGHIVATRGSFTSDQAVHATRLWQRDYAGLVDVPAGITLLVEIVYGTNKIVVDYGTRDELVLLAAIDNRTGADVGLWEIEWPASRAEMFPVTSLDEAYTFATGPRFADAEGVVLVWPRPGTESYRLKIKHPEYIARHALIYGLSTLSVWRRLAAGVVVDDLLVQLPDETHEWVRHTSQGFLAQHAALVEIAQSELATVPRDVARPAQARIVKRLNEPSLVFALLDGHDIGPQVWKRLRPDYVPFRT